MLNSSTRTYAHIARACAKTRQTGKEGKSPFQLKNSQLPLYAWLILYLGENMPVPASAWLVPEA
jgi:hypothetical protein